MSVARRLEGLLARTIARLPSGVARRLGGKPVVVDGQTWDPHLQILLGLNKKGGFETLGSAEAARAAYLDMIHLLEREEAPPAAIHDRTIEGKHGPIPIRIYEPASTSPRPAIVFFHGGGFVIGDLESHDRLCRRFSNELGATVVAAHYRLGPEQPFPRAPDDCASVAQWVVDSTESLGVDCDRIALAGDSAGGNLAAVVSQEVDGIAFQLLIYPGTDAAAETDSKRLFAKGYGLDQSTIDWFLSTYIQSADPTHPRVSPLRSETLHRCPPTHVATAGYDVLRDEGRELAHKLRAVGVPCTFTNHETLSHGFVHLTRLPGCDAGVADLVVALRRGLES